MVDDRGQKTEVGNQRPEDRGQKTGGRCQKSEVGGQRTDAFEFGSRKSENMEEFECRR